MKGMHNKGLRAGTGEMTLVMEWSEVTAGVTGALTAAMTTAVGASSVEGG